MRLGIYATERGKTGMIWIPATPETMPIPGRRILFTWKNEEGKRLAGLGFYASQYMVEADETAYHDENNAKYFDIHPKNEIWYMKPGFVEERMEPEETLYLVKNVTHWQELPEFPED